MLEDIEIEDVQKSAKEYRNLFEIHKEKKIFVFTDKALHTPKDGVKTEQNRMQDSISNLMRELDVGEDPVYKLTVECLNFLSTVTE